MTFTAPNGTTFKANSTQRWLLTGKGRKPGRDAMKAAASDLRAMGYPQRYQQINGKATPVLHFF